SYAPGEYIYLLLYVDDMMIACKSKAGIWSTKSLLKKEFDMKELTEAKKILGMEIVRDQSRKILRVSQSGYVSKILNYFRIDNGKSVQIPLCGHFKLSLKDCPFKDCDVERMSKVPYANVVRSLMYLMVCTRPNIAYAVSVVSRYLANPDHGNHVDVIGFVDSDYIKNPNKDRSITGYTFLVQGCVVSWKATLQHMVVLSTTEAEYMALTEAGAIHLSRNHVFHERTKHINVRYHFMREVLEANTVEVLNVGTKHNGAVALTKVVPGLKLQHCLELLSVGDEGSCMWCVDTLGEVDRFLGSTSSPVTVEADVYSYVILLLEIVGGRRNLDMNFDANEFFFPGWAFKTTRRDELLRALKVGFWCIQDEVSMRPSMSEVVMMLVGSVEVSEPPMPQSVLELVEEGLDHVTRQ
ncbi:retrovirus-related pol polyprotein from transposon TNT 1-94, partial [Tanacetum coccineum]